MRLENRLPRLQVKSTSKDSIHRFAAAVGCGCVYGPYNYGTRLSHFVWIADGDAAALTADALVPYLSGTARERVERALGVEGQVRLAPPPHRSA